MVQNTIANTSLLTLGSFFVTSAIATYPTAPLIALGCAVLAIASFVAYDILP